MEIDVCQYAHREIIPYKGKKIPYSAKKTAALKAAAEMFISVIFDTFDRIFGSIHAKHNSSESITVFLASKYTNINAFLDEVVGRKVTIVVTCA